MATIALTDEKRAVMAHAIVGLSMRDPAVLEALQSDLNLSTNELELSQEDTRILLRAVREYESSAVALVQEAERQVVARQQLEKELSDQLIS